MRGGGERRWRQQSGDEGCGKDGGSRRQRRQTTTAMAADDGGGRRQWTMTACKIGRRITMGKGKSGRQTMTALSIRDGEDDVVFNGGHMIQIFVVNSTICCFWRGYYDFFCVGFFLTKEKIVHTTLCTTYVEKKRPKTPSTSQFLGRKF
jgi:hypothetical protein